jgi:hypothetical protein
MRSAATAVLSAGAAAIAAAGLLTAAADRRELAFVNGVAPRDPALELEPRHTACQREVEVMEPFSRVRLALDTRGRAGPPLDLRVSRHGSGRLLGKGRAAGGYLASARAPEESPVVEVGPVPAGGEVDVCVRNAGSASLLIGGSTGSSREAGDLEAGERRLEPVDASAHVTFLRERPTSLLAQLPAAFRRAALFHPPLVGAWTFWLLSALVLVALPWLLAIAVRSAAEDPGGG